MKRRFLFQQINSNERHRFERFASSLYEKMERRFERRSSQQTQTICRPFVQRRPKVFDFGPALYKCYTNVLCLLGWHSIEHACSATKMRTAPRPTGTARVRRSTYIVISYKKRELQAKYLISYIICIKI